MKFDYGQVVLISDRVGISPRRTEKFLKYLKDQGEGHSLDIQRAIGLPTSVINPLGDYLSRVVQHDGDSYGLSGDGVTYVDELTSFRSERDRHMVETIPKIAAEVEKLEASMPKSKRRLDQVRATPESVAKRVQFLYDRGYLEDRSIMLMGDNDATSIGLALTGYPKRLTVFDIDSDLLKFLATLSENRQLGIECKRYDVRNVFPHEGMHKYDVVVTDPPYAPDGFDMFIQRCIQGIKADHGTLAISYGFSDRSRERALPIQEILTDRGLVIEELVPLFNRYFAAQVIGCQSGMYLCKTTPKTTDEDMQMDGELYTYRHPHKRSRRDHRTPFSNSRNFRKQDRRGSNDRDGEDFTDHNRIDLIDKDRIVLADKARRSPDDKKWF